MALKTNILQYNKIMFRHLVRKTGPIRLALVQQAGWLADEVPGGS